jgi:hypothetical protein
VKSPYRAFKTNTGFRIKAIPKEIRNKYYNKNHDLSIDSLDNISEISDK